MQRQEKMTEQKTPRRDGFTESTKSNATRKKIERKNEVKKNGLTDFVEWALKIAVSALHEKATPEDAEVMRGLVQPLVNLVAEVERDADEFDLHRAGADLREAWAEAEKDNIENFILEEMAEVKDEIEARPKVRRLSEVKTRTELNAAIREMVKGLA